jgi:hypothetical protein
LVYFSPSWYILSRKIWQPFSRAENSEDSLDSAAVLEVHVPPRFLRTPQNVVSVEKGDVEFECEVYGVPAATIQWYKNGDLIIESEYFQAKYFYFCTYFKIKELRSFLF